MGVTVFARCRRIVTTRWLPAAAVAAIALAWAGAAAALDADQAQLAKQVIEQRTCRNCHTLAGEGAPGPGPNLTDVGSRRTKEWLRRWLRDPQAIKPGTLMPTFNWTDQELDAVIAHLVSFAATKDRGAVRDAAASAASSDAAPKGGGWLRYWWAAALVAVVVAAALLSIAAARRRPGK